MTSGVVSSTRRALAGLLMLTTAACGSKKSTPVDPGPQEPAPKLTCPANVAEVIKGGEKAVTFDAPTSTGGTGTVTIGCTPSSGANFPLGATTVNCTGTDQANRSATCSFTVTLTASLVGVKKIGTYGDSLTLGENGKVRPSFVDPPNAYPTKLQDLFRASFPNQGVTVSNHGFSGHYASQVLADLPADLQADQAEVAILLAGENDLEFCGGNGYNSAGCQNGIFAAEDGIRGLMRTAKNFPTVRYVIVSTLPPPGPVEAGYTDRARDIRAIQDLNALIKRRVAEEGVYLVDMYQVFQGHEAEYVSGDGLHLDPAGYQAMAQAFYDKILSIVPVTSFGPSLYSGGR